MGRRILRVEWSPPTIHLRGSLRVLRFTIRGGFIRSLCRGIRAQAKRVRGGLLRLLGLCHPARVSSRWASERGRWLPTLARLARPPLLRPKLLLLPPRPRLLLLPFIFILPLLSPHGGGGFPLWRGRHAPDRWLRQPMSSADRLRSLLSRSVLLPSQSKLVQ